VSPDIPGIRKALSPSYLKRSLREGCQRGQGKPKEVEALRTADQHTKYRD